MGLVLLLLCNNLCGKVKHELRVASSKPQVTSSNVRVTSSNLHVTSSSPRVRALKHGLKD